MKKTLLIIAIAIIGCSKNEVAPTVAPLPTTDTTRIVYDSVNHSSIPSSYYTLFYQQRQFLFPFVNGVPPTLYRWLTKESLDSAVFLLRSNTFAGYQTTDVVNWYRVKNVFAFYSSETLSGKTTYYLSSKSFDIVMNEPDIFLSKAYLDTTNKYEYPRHIIGSISGLPSEGTDTQGNWLNFVAPVGNGILLPVKR